MNAPLCELWLLRMRWPVLLFVPLAAVLALTEIDMVIARNLSFDASSHSWIGAHNWWVGQFLHTGGRWAVRIMVAASIALCVASFRVRELRQIRRPAAYFSLATILAVGVVGLLKIVTNVDCPWDLLPFGGQFPVVQLFDHRPDALRAGHCFPAAHASSGYALMALYFVALERSQALARAGLALGVLCGVVFGVAQQARGAHLASHDVWSAFIVWGVCTGVYVFGFRAQLHA